MKRLSLNHFGGNLTNQKNCGKNRIYSVFHNSEEY